MVEWITEYWPHLVLTAVVVIAAIVSERLLTRALYRLQVAGTLPALQARLIRRAIQWLAFVLTALTIFTIFGGGAAKLWTYVGAILAVVGIGFIAQWSALSNVLASFIILVWRPFRVGERVELLPDGPTGRVEDLNTMFTTLRSDDGTRLTVPNNLFLQRPLRCGMPNASTRLPESEAMGPADAI